jgi:hypothetical protein
MLQRITRPQHTGTHIVDELSTVMSLLAGHECRGLYTGEPSPERQRLETRRSGSTDGRARRWRPMPRLRTSDPLSPLKAAFSKAKNIQTDLELEWRPAGEQSWARPIPIGELK